MSSTIAPQEQTAADDYGLDAVAEHNTATKTERFPPYQEDPKGLGIYQDGFYQEEQSVLHNPPTPHSNAETEGVRTRSGRSARRTDSPLGTDKARVSKSPATRSKKERKSKVLEKAKMPKLTAPLSVLTKDSDVPVKDMDAWVHRPAEVRREEAEKRHGYVTRPMNSFMLYRSAYAERTKAWATQNNHQVVSSVAGESWPMEPEEVRNQFNEWAKIERANHAAAHPDYKFSPSKTAKKRKGGFSDDEDDGSDLDGDPDGEYRAGGRNARQRKPRADLNEVTYLNGLVGFNSNPYYAQQGYEIPQYDYANMGRALPSHTPYDGGNGMVYNPEIGTYVQSNVHHQHNPSYGYSMPQEMRISTPTSQHGAQSLGGFGLPGQMTADDLFVNSRTGTPVMQQYNQYGQPIYPQYQQYPAAGYHQPPNTAQQRVMYEHQQYLRSAAQPQTAIDPGLAVGPDNHFDEAIGDISGDVNYSDMPEFVEESRSPDQTLAPRWVPTAADLAG